MAMGSEVRKSGLRCVRSQERAVGWRYSGERWVEAEWVVVLTVLEREAGAV